MQLKPITAIAVLLLAVASLSVSGCTTQIPEPISEPLNTTTTEPLNTTTATASTSATSPTVSRAVLQPNWLEYLTSYMGYKGYTVTEPFEYEYTVAATSNSVYEGELAKNGVEYKCILEPTKNLNEARLELTSSVRSLERLGYVGNYTDANTWNGTLIDDGEAVTGNTWFEPTWSIPVVITVFAD